MNQALSALAREAGLAAAEHDAVTGPAAFGPEFTWRLDELRRLAQARQPTPGGA